MPVSSSNNSLPLYTGTWDCAKKTISKEGIRGLYKGIYILYKCSIANINYIYKSYKYLRTI